MCTPTAPPSNLQLLSSSKNLGRIPLSPRLALWGLKRTRPSTQLRQLLRSRARCASSSRTSHSLDDVDGRVSGLRAATPLVALVSPVSAPPAPRLRFAGCSVGYSSVLRYDVCTHIRDIPYPTYTRTLSSFTQPMPHTCTRRCCVSLLLAEKTCVEPVLARVVQVLVKIDHVVLHTCACTRLARVSAS
jgi:hypothetical protein